MSETNLRDRNQSVHSDSQTCEACIDMVMVGKGERKMVDGSGPMDRKGDIIIYKCYIFLAWEHNSVVVYLPNKYRALK